MERVIFKNRIAVAYWGFTAVWLSIVAGFTWVLVRDGPPPGYPGEIMWALIALFWLGGLALAGYTMDQPLYAVAMNPQAVVSFTWQYPHKRIRKSYEAEQLGRPRVVEGTGSDGEPYYFARLDLPDGSVADLAEGHDRDRCEAAVARFTQIITRSEA